MSTTLRPVAAGFACYGLFWGSWAIATFDVERSLHLNDDRFGLLLAVAVAAGAAANAVGGPLAERWGTTRAMTRALALWGLLTVAVTLTRGVSLFTAVFAVALVAGGGVDVVMNIAAAAGLAGSSGRLVRFHAWYNAGTVVGAGLTGLALHLGLSWRWCWAAIGFAACAIAFVSRRSPLPAGGAGESHGLFHSLTLLRRERLLLLAAVFSACALVEGGITTWGVLFLRSRVATGVLVGTGAYVAGQALATVGRATLGPSVGALGGARGAAAGGGLAAVGIFVEAIAPSTPVAVGGLVAAALGISMCWPLLVSSVGDVFERPAVAVGGLTAAGYLGIVAGPPLVGAVSGLAGLRAGLGLLAAIAAAASVAAALRLAPLASR
jgi:MFS family permease